MKGYYHVLRVVAGHQVEVDAVSAYDSYEAVRKVARQHGIPEHELDSLEMLPRCARPTASRPPTGGFGGRTEAPAAGLSRPGTQGVPLSKQPAPLASMTFCHVIFSAVIAPSWR